MIVSLGIVVRALKVLKVGCPDLGFFHQVPDLRLNIANFSTLKESQVSGLAA